jgi:hypothetical protein
MLGVARNQPNRPQPEAEPKPESTNQVPPQSEDEPKIEDVPYEPKEERKEEQVPQEDKLPELCFEFLQKLLSIIHESLPEDEFRNLQ